LGYGQRPDVTEVDGSGRVDYDARFVAKTDSYRAYRFPWRGRPLTKPKVGHHRVGNRIALYASWNGETGIRGWKVLGGELPSRLHRLGNTGSQGFETHISVLAEPYLRVEAIGAGGRILGRSALLRIHVPVVVRRVKAHHRRAQEKAGTQARRRAGRRAHGRTRGRTHAKNHGKARTHVRRTTRRLRRGN